MRIIVPIVAIIIGLAFAFGVMSQSNKRDARQQQTIETTATDQAAQQGPTQQQPAATREPQPDRQAAAAPKPVAQEIPAHDSATEQDVAQAPVTHQQAIEETKSSVPSLSTLTVLPHQAGETVLMGASDPATGYKMQVNMTPYGAGVWQIMLSEYNEHVYNPEKYVIFDTPRNGFGQPLYYAFAAQSIEINGQSIYLGNIAWSTSGVKATQNGQAVTWTAEIGTESDQQPVLRIERTFKLAMDSYDLNIGQKLVNLTNHPLHVVWQQNIQGDMPAEGESYLGDRRRYVTGYINPRYDGGAPLRVYTDKALWTRHQLLDVPTIWPNSSLPHGVQMFWIASENRYFSMVTHLPVPEGATHIAQVEPLESMFPTLHQRIMPTPESASNMSNEQRAMVFILETASIEIEPGQTKDLSMGVYVGPTKRHVLNTGIYAILGLPELIYYSLGGPCAMCTFQWLAKFLLSFLELIHSVVLDWGIAIIILVIVVRILLHPITKKAQVNMLKLQKQMSALQPEMEKLKKKYKDNPSQLNTEMMKLYREKGVNPANMLGCLPMFLQMPIWLALYSMLYFAIELRHQPAFYNVFHRIGDLVGINWQFLTDLSTPDHFIVLFNEPRIINLHLIVFDYSAINILPILMGIVFYFQNKLMTPPPANEQMAQQQKIMRFMMLLFPFFLYSAPSGLTLYICTSTAAGILDSWLVRRHVRKQEEAGTLFEKKERKPGGIMDRLAKRVEAQRLAMENRQQASSQNKGGQKRKKR